MEAHPECLYRLREPAEDGLLQVSGTGGLSRRPANYISLASPERFYHRWQGKPYHRKLRTLRPEAWSCQCYL